MAEPAPQPVGSPVSDSPEERQDGRAHGHPVNGDGTPHREGADVSPGDSTPAGGEADNTAEDNYGQLVQAAVIQGGVHYYGATSERFTFDAESTRLVREARRVDPHRVTAIRATFVPPEGYAAFAEDFRNARIGVVTGRPNNGRATTAIHALDTHGMDIREVTAEASDRGWRPERLPAEPDHAYLLDITAHGSETDAHHPRVREYSRRVRASGGRLVVIAEEWEEDPADGYAVLAVRPADAGEVFLRHLAHLTSRVDAERWAAEPRIRAVLAAQGPAEATRLAKQVQRVSRPRGGPPGEVDFPTLVDSVLGMVRNHEKWIRDWFADHEKAATRAEARRFDPRHDPQDRAQPERREELRPGDYLRVLLEAVAVLEGCPSDAVLVQVDELAREWDVPVRLPSPISGGGLTAMLQEIRARVDTEDRIVFDRPGFGDVALDHLWREFPKARQPLLSWSNRAANHIPPDDRRQVAVRWLHLAERQRDPGPVNGLLVAWGDSRQLRAAAVPVVARAAVQDELGPAVREHLYQLARNDRQGKDLDIAVAQVCGQYGKVEPHTALVRLRWLADRAHGVVADTVQQALDAIWAERTCRPVLLGDLVEWASDAKGRGRVEFARRYLGALLASVGDDGMPALLVETATSTGAPSPGLVGAAMAATVGGPRARGGAVLDAWIAALENLPSGGAGHVADDVLRHATAADTAANVRIGRRLGAWARDRPGGPSGPLAERVRGIDPLARQSVHPGGDPS